MRHCTQPTREVEGFSQFFVTLPLTGSDAAAAARRLSRCSGFLTALSECSQGFLWFPSPPARTRSGARHDVTVSPPCQVRLSASLLCRPAAYWLRETMLPGRPDGHFRCCCCCYCCNRLWKLCSCGSPSMFPPQPPSHPSSWSMSPGCSCWRPLYWDKWSVPPPPPPSPPCDAGARD